MPCTAQRFSWLIDLSLLVLLGCLFYTAWLGSYPVFIPDEGRYSEVAREMLATHDYITPRVNGIAFLDKPILHYWLQALAISLFGVKEWALRLFPALLGVWGCLITYIGGRCLFNRRTGLLSAIILATAPLYFGNAHYANLDLELAVFISSTLLCFIIAIQREDRARLYFLFAAYVFAALAFLTKGLMAIVFPALIVGAWMIATHRFRLIKKLHLLTGSFIFLILVLPWYILVQKANPHFLYYFFVTQQVTRFLAQAHFNNEAPLWFYLPVIAIGFFPWTIFLIQAIYHHIKNILCTPEVHQNELFLLIWVFLLFIFFSIPQSKIVGYILPVFSALALLCGHYISNVWENCKKRSLIFSALQLILIELILAALILAAAHYHWIDIISPEIQPALVTIVSIFICSAFFDLFFIKKYSLKSIFMICTLSNIIFLLVLVSNAKYLNQESTKELTQSLQKIMQPQDEVVTYFKYYQDIPLYLGRRITVVADWHASDIANKDNWRREFWLGMPFQKTDAWLIEENIFWKRWFSDKRLFVFVHKNDLKKFQKKTHRYFILYKNNELMVLSNQPNKK